MDLTQSEIKQYQENALELIRKTVLKYIPCDDYAVFLFGSRAGDSPRRTSDFDIGVYGKENLPGTVWGDVNEELENLNIPYLVDVIDFSKTSDEFKAIALKKIILWNQPKNFKIYLPN